MDYDINQVILDVISNLNLLEPNQEYEKRKVGGNSILIFSILSETEIFIEYNAERISIKKYIKGNCIEEYGIFTDENGLLVVCSAHKSEGNVVSPSIEYYDLDSKEKIFETRDLSTIEGLVNEEIMGISLVA